MTLARFVAFVGVLLGMITGLVSPSAFAQSYLEAAQKEGEVVVYGANLNETVDPMHKAFEKKYGVAVKYWRGASTAVAVRATSEWRSGRPDFDVVQGNRGLQLIMAKEGLFAKHVAMVASLAPVPIEMTKGEALVGITYVKYVLQHKGPVDYVALDKYLTDANYLSVGARARHPNAAKLYVDFASSAEGQEFLAKTGDFVLYPGIYPPVRAAEKVVANMVIMDSPTEQEMKKLREDFREIFAAK